MKPLEKLAVVVVALAAALFGTAAFLYALQLIGAPPMNKVNIPTSLLEKYRMARNVTEGMDIWDPENKEWCRVTNTLHIVSPIPVMRFEFVDDSVAAVHPKARVMSRRVVENEVSA
jgi:hypothetical protein